MGTLELKPPKPGTSELKRTLGPLMLWGLGVGYVISGMYFGWNLGLPEGGPYGLLGATLLVTLMYVSFVISYTELSCAIPRAGGAFVYGTRALGSELGFLAGMAQIVEFVFAPPAIAWAIGSYFSLFPFFHNVPPLAIAIVAYFIFTGLNIYGVKQSAIFELVITILAVLELLLFVSLTMPHFQWEVFSRNPLPNGWGGMFAALPFAIWFYLAIEGVANVAEETIDPQRAMVKGFGSAMATLVVLALLVFFSAVGVNGWESVVFPAGSTIASDSPLPLALAHVVGSGNIFYHLLLTVGLFGLIASFHGIILVAGRATLEFGRAGYIPQLLGETLPKRKTPAAALIANMLVGLIALASGRTGDIIIIAVFGALTLYFISMISLFVLRHKEPELIRPFKTPLYPILPALALLISFICLVAMAWFNRQQVLLYLGILALGYAWFYLKVPIEVRSQKDEGRVVENALQTTSLEGKDGQ